MKKRPLFVTLGIPSLFLIFSVLCLVILALLSLGTSREDLQTSRLAMEQTEAYYTACAKASDLCTQTETLLLDAKTKAPDENAWFSMAETLPELLSGVTYDKNTHLLTLELSYTDKQTLHVTLKLCYPETSSDSFLEILDWKTQSIGTWEPDMKQPVFKGE